VCSDGGKSINVTATDRCEGCDVTNLDFSPAAFKELADESVGRIKNITWIWSDLLSVDVSVSLDL
jgi:hypothetical protein